MKMLVCSWLGTDLFQKENTFCKLSVPILKISRDRKAFFSDIKNPFSSKQHLEPSFPFSRGMVMISHAYMFLLSAGVLL